MFAIPASQYARAVSFRVAERYWWIPALAFATCLLAATQHTAFIYIAFMCIFLIFPTVASITYFYYAFAPDATAMIAEHYVVLTSEQIEIIVPSHPRLNKTYFVSDIKNVEYTKNNVVIQLRKPSMHNIQIPESIVPDNQRQNLDRLLQNYNPDV